MSTQLSRKRPVAPDVDEMYDDRYYEMRQPNSTRKYQAVPTKTRTVMRVTRHEGPPPIHPRASRTTTQAPQRQQQQQQTPGVQTASFSISGGDWLPTNSNRIQLTFLVAM